MQRFEHARPLGSSSWRVGAPSRALLMSVALATPAAHAHIDLLEPPARVSGRPDSMLLRGPCGQRQNERDEERVSVFRAGQSIDVVWDAYVQHVSYFRIAFDPDGDDSFSTRPSSPRDASADDPTLLPAGGGEIILDYVLDPTGDVEHVERSVTLPDIECERCTLQLTQFTYGLPLDDAIYYQCADLVLEPGEDDGAGPASAAVDAGAVNAGEGSSGCSIAATSGVRPSSSGARGVGWLAAIAGAAALCVRRRARRRSARR